MSIRTNWTDYDKETRKYIKKRDNNECLICNYKGALQIAHIFLSRAQGGRGCKENGVLLCVKCHAILDNPIGNKEYYMSKFYLEHCKKYLNQVESLWERFTSEKDLIDNYLKFDKTKIDKQLQIIEKPIVKETCKTCKYLKKSKTMNKGLPFYLCDKTKKVVAKKNGSCKNYENMI